MRRINLRTAHKRNSNLKLINSAIKNISKKGINETFNITFGKARTLVDYVRILKKYFKNLKFEVIKRDEKRPKRGTLKIDKAKKILGFRPKINLEKGIEIYIKNFRRK